MRPRVLVLLLTPREVIARVVRDVRRRQPDAEVTVLAGAGGHEEARAAGADQVLGWQERSGLELVGEVRRGQFDMMVVAHGDDQYASGAYWKAVGLAALSGARERVFWEDGRWRERGRLAGVAIGGVRGAFQAAAEAYVAAVGLLIFFALLIGVAVTDLGEAVVGRGAAGAPSRGGKE
jgi:hypothetical protein